MGIKLISMVSLAALFLSTQAHADTRVFVYNNTLQTLDLTLRQVDTSLDPTYWSRGARSIAPTQAEEVLSIKKSGGVSNNTTYGFELDVSDGSTDLTLKIRVEGRAVGRRTSQAVGSGAFFSDSTLRSALWGGRTVRFRQEGNGDFMFVISDPSKPVLRFPVQDRSLIDESNDISNPLGGPLTLDMRAGDRSRGLGLACLAFDGRKNPPHCYSGHKGTDFMLKGGFPQMDRPGNFVVSAAAGTVVAVVQNLYDRCRAKAYSNDAESLLQPDCDGNNPGLAGNHVIVDHGDGLYTEYYHLKTNSALVEVGQEVSCGEPLASIGSSGYSTKPHLHFEVYDCKAGESCSTHTDGDLVSVNPYNGIYTGRGYWVRQGSGRLPSSACAPGQPVYQGETAPPARGCSADSDCSPGFFCNRRLGENRCLPDGSSEIGATCSKNAECSSGKCQGSGSNRTCVCAADSDCGAGEFCNTRLAANRCLADASLLVGQACSKNSECDSGKCQGSGSNRMCVCARDSDCGAGEFCNTRLGTNRCLTNASLALGQACNKNSECDSGKCQGSGNNRMCVCARDSDCGAGEFCNTRLGTNRCLADESLALGQTCSKNAECDSGKCQGSGSNRMCVCAQDSDCPGSQRCRKRVGRNICR